MKGKVFWAPAYGRDVCPIHACAGEKGLVTCRDCGGLPCPIWTDTRDPSVGDEEFKRQIASRLANLRAHQPRPSPGGGQTAPASPRDR